jgi:hypothetical protein
VVLGAWAERFGPAPPHHLKAGKDAALTVAGYRRNRWSDDDFTEMEEPGHRPGLYCSRLPVASGQFVRYACTQTPLPKNVPNKNRGKTGVAPLLAKL